jgi:hypothetical protein
VCSATTDAWKVYNNNAIFNHFVKVFWKVLALYACQEIIEIMAFLSVPSSLSCVRGLFHVLCCCIVASTIFLHQVFSSQNSVFGSHLEQLQRVSGYGPAK